MYKGFNYTNGMFKVTILKKDGTPSVASDGTVIGEQTLALNTNKNSSVIAGSKSSDGKIIHVAFKVADKAKVEGELALKELYLVNDQSQVSDTGEYCIAMARPIKKFEL